MTDTTLKYTNNVRRGCIVRSGSNLGFLIFVSLFFINPFATIFIYSLYLITKKSKTDSEFYFLYFLISIYLGLMNTTKVPESDLLRYKEYFELASYLDFFNYISLYSKEIIFYIGTYISNKLLFGNFKLYIILFTFFQYYLIFISIHKFFKNEEKSILIFAVLLFAIFNRFFFASAHLVRQILAGSIFVYFFITRIVDNKTHWWLIPIAFLIHSSSAVLFLLSFVPQLGKKLSFKNAMIFSIVAIGASFLGGYVINVLDSLTKGISYLNYPFQRFHILDHMEYSWYDGGSVGSNRYWYYVQLLPIVLFAYFFIKGRQTTYYILNFTLFLVFLLEFFVLTGLSYMQLRTMYYIYLMVPFVYPLLFIRNSFINDNALKFLGMFFIIGWFSLRLIRGLTGGGMEFASLTELIIYPIPLFFIY